MTRTLEYESTVELIDLISDFAMEEFEILKAHHPEGPHTCEICGPEIPGLLARLEQILASVEAWRKTNS